MATSQDQVRKVFAEVITPTVAAAIQANKVFAEVIGATVPASVQMQKVFVEVIAAAPLTTSGTHPTVFVCT